MCKLSLSVVRAFITESELNLKTRAMERQEDYPAQKNT